MTEVGYSPTHNKSVDLGTKYQFQLASQKERTRYYVPPDERTHHDLYSLAKGTVSVSAQTSGSMYQYPEDRGTC